MLVCVDLAVTARGTLAAISDWSFWSWLIRELKEHKREKKKKIKKKREKEITLKIRHLSDLYFERKLIRSKISITCYSNFHVSNICAYLRMWQLQ